MCVHDKVNIELDKSLAILDNNVEKAKKINSEIKIIRTNFLIKMARKLVVANERAWDAHEPCKGKA